MADDLAAAIRARLASFDNEACYGGCGCEDNRCAVYGFEEMHAAILAVLELHADAETDIGVAEHVGYTVMRWHKPANDPTLLAIAEALGIEATDA